MLIFYFRSFWWSSCRRETRTHSHSLN